MAGRIQSTPIKNLLPHPGNPNRMSKENFRKLVRHIERTGRYEPLTVRQHPQDSRCFQIINGHHRFEALKQLGYETCDCVVWNIDDDEANLLLATLNRLCGQDVLEKKAELLAELNNKLKVDKLAKLLPNTKTQIQRLIDLHKKSTQIQLTEPDGKSFAYPMVFFLNHEQKQTVEKALSLASADAANRAQRNAQAITQIAKCFIKYREPEVKDGNENQVRSTGTG
jgi:ParB/RepB/Spo0J family partition protein